MGLINIFKNQGVSQGNKVESKPSEIPMINTGVNYNLGQISQREIDSYVEGLVDQKIMQELKFGEKGFSRPVMFPRKTSKVG